MVKIVLGTVFVFTIIVTVRVSAAGRTDPCSIAVHPYSPGPDQTYFWGVLGPDTLLVGSGSISPTGEPGHWGWAREDAPVFGQSVVLGAYGGAASEVLDSIFQANNRTNAVIVLWDYDAACEPTKWGGSSQWGVMGHSAYFSAYLRDVSSWAEGVPTFDSYWAGQMIYPFSALKVHSDSALEHDSLRRPFSQAFPEALTAEQVYELVASLPQVCEYYFNPKAAIEKLATVKRTDRRLITRYPGDRIIRVHDSRAEDVADGEPSDWLREICAA